MPVVPARVLATTKAIRQRTDGTLSPDPGYGIGRAIRPRALATRPCRHVRSRCTETAGSRGACGRARAVAWRASCAPRNDRSASSLAGRPCLIIGVRECRHGTGNIVRRASVEATSVVGDRARVRRFRRIRTVHISGRTSPDSGRTSGSLRASRIASPHWGQISAASGSFRTSMKLRGLDHD